MEEQTQNLRAGESDPEKTVVADPEKTLVAPRFDAREVVTAQPVVPLAESPAARRERRQGTLPILLILVSALIGGLVSVFAYRLYQQRVQQPSARERQQPAAVEAPALTPEISARAPAETPAETPAAMPEVIEEPQPTPATEVAEVREAATPEETAERGEAREDKAGRDLEAARTREAREERPATRSTPAAARTTPAPARRPTARRVEEITTPTGDLRVRRERRGNGEADDDEAPARQRANRRAARREGERNIDRVRAIFEGPPPGR